MQAQRLGAEIIAVQDACSLEAKGNARLVRLADGSELNARSVLLATGVEYQRLNAPGLEALTGRGVYYGAVHVEDKSVAGRQVYLIGGANSAGQAAVYVSRCTAGHARRPRRQAREKHVALPHRADTRRAQRPVRINSEVVAALARSISKTSRRRPRDRSEEHVAADFLFVFIGAHPILNGSATSSPVTTVASCYPDRSAARRRSPRWPLEREPALLETSCRCSWPATSDVVHEAGCVGGRRRRDGRPPGPPVPGDAVMLADELGPPSCSRASPPNSDGAGGAGQRGAVRGRRDDLRRGQPAEFLWVLLGGEMGLERHVGGQRIRSRQRHGPGRMAAACRPSPARRRLRLPRDGQAAQPSRFFRLPSSDLGRLLGEWSPVAQALSRRLPAAPRSIEATVRERERLISLGRMAAGLAHEINNPAAAALRAVAELRRRCSSSRGCRAGSPERTCRRTSCAAAALRGAAAASPPPAGAGRLERGQRRGRARRVGSTRRGSTIWSLASTFAATARRGWLDERRQVVGPAD